ncbi:MAG TPA: ATP-binding protein [Candidatus Saccharimonadales bacterium]|nr:ATP-binding protein [Candidatus Saccharimonadales bacterium]
MAKGLFRRLLCSLAIIGMAVVLLQSVASADAAYGSGKYGDCPEQENCAVTQPTTTVTTGGLQVVINLTDGQKIPKDSYAITVTPVAGQTLTIDHVDFSIDGTPAATVQPDPVTGAVRWVWDVSSNPGTTVTVTVTDSNGQAVTTTYHVQLVDRSVSTPRGSGSSRGSRGSSNPVAAAAQAALNGATRLIGRLPKPVIRSFPYLLFLILAGNMIILGLQTRHELHELGVAKQLLERQREVANAKKVLMELISHYFRTPLTLLDGGVEMLTASPEHTVLNKLHASLSEKVERLIAQTRDESAVVDTLPAVDVNEVKAHFWRRPALFLPIVLIGGAALLFDFLAHRAEALNVSQTNVITQALAFCSVVVLTYLLFRHLHLRRRDARELERTMAAEAAVAQARDDLISETATLLQQDTAQLGKLAAKLPAGDATGFIVDSHVRLEALIEKVQLASSLHGAHGSGPLQTVPLDELLRQATGKIAKAAAKKRIVLPVGNAELVPSRNPDLLASVVASLLDNAVAYSQDGGKVELDYKLMGRSAVITVTDHGSGIPEDRLQSLFIPFQKLEGSETFNHEGMGFSLYLDRLIMAYLGGMISASVPEGGGTCITLVLPAAESAPSQPAPVRPTYVASPA